MRNIKGKWKVASNYIGDQKKYAVYRLIDVNQVDHSGNREFAPAGWLDSRTMAAAIAEGLNKIEEEQNETI